MSDYNYIGHRPKECCDGGYYDGGRGWWCCGSRHEREMHFLRQRVANMTRALEYAREHDHGEHYDPGNPCLLCAQIRAALASSTTPTHRHYKGGLYRLIDTARHSETGEELAIYECIRTTTGEHPKTHQLWARPLSMFNELVDGVPRFKLLDGGGTVIKPGL